ncbi:hypothetical protein U1Q18_012599 [Sarracenia purpurea var. burkii]
MGLWREVEFCSADLTVRIPRSGHLGRRSVIGGDRRPARDCRPSLRNAWAKSTYGTAAQAYAISSYPRKAGARCTSHLNEGRSRRRDQESRRRWCCRRSPSGGKRDPSRRLRRL